MARAESREGPAQVTVSCSSRVEPEPRQQGFIKVKWRRLAQAQGPSWRQGEEIGPCRPSEDQWVRERLCCFLMLLGC